MREPETIRLARRPIVETDCDRGARESDVSRLITAPATVVDANTGEVVLVYLAPIEEDTRVLVAVLRHIDMPATDRMSGMVSQWRTFGYTPRNGYRQHDACEVSSLAREEPTEHEVICSYAPVIARYYERYGPATYDQHSRAVRRVRPEWTLDRGVFTSGVVNKDAALPYHHDTTNFKGVWSGMLGFKHGVTGGFLAVPEYDLAVEVADQSLTLFDGQALLHGVTPFRVEPGGYRYTVVYYSRAGMVACLRPGEEVKRRR